MRSLSNIIKSDFVLYNRDPMVIKIMAAEKAAGEDVPETAQSKVDDETLKEIEKSQKALDEAENILRSAVKEADDIIKRGKIEAKLVYFQAAQEGRQRGYQDGLNKGRADGQSQAARNVSASVKKVIEHIASLDSSYANNMAEVKADCVDFAFGLAENILGIRIDRSSDDYQRLIGKFLCTKSCKATIEVDGCVYPFETLRTDGLVPCSDGLQGILVSCDEPAEIDKEEAEDKPQDIPEISASDDGENAPQAFDADEADAVESTDTGDEEPNEAQAEVEEAEETEDEPEIEPQDNLEGDISDSKDFEDETGVQDEDDDTENIEKFVFVRPTKRPVALSMSAETGGEFVFTELSQLDKSSLKAILKKAEIKDIVAALDGADDDTKSAFMDAMTRRTKEKVLDVMKYLGPVQKQEIDAARGRILKIASDTLKNLERNESDV